MNPMDTDRGCLAGADPEEYTRFLEWKAGLNQEVP